MTTRRLIVIFALALSCGLGTMHLVARAADAYPTAISDAATYVPPTEDATGSENGAYPTEISDAATYVPPTEDATGSENGAYPTEISDPATFVPPTEGATGSENGAYPTEISDAATYVPAPTSTAVASDPQTSASSSGSAFTASTNPVLAQQLPNTGSGSGRSSGFPWILVCALTLFAGTMVIKFRRATQKF